LSRNRDFLLLWSGQAVSVVGTHVSALALPLLVLAERCALTWPGSRTVMLELLAPYGIEAQSAGELKLAEPEETGKTFAENARIKAENDALKAAKDAESHNAQTARVLQRGKAPNLAPGGGGPPAPGKLVEPKPIPPDRKAFDQAVSEWSKVRDQ